ncbi:WXG100 family type VII secretion target [Cellulomonas chengniuliangii]|uniref:ESAT-6-like protein n=1 Tax=Cellulomonas chengniuliangii TaxID=2968084 RepID=A0ABY5KWJ8_9CELL|nr:WXG100 family type VII secretion target [Cellulomonas chengniuliangii]MCC2309580.1 WXG100 family type VII secretion target [Cellulomonas chengniuliangii]MCC2318875.1 WXG100 family type VII secretion target [Cellulomonas chengniuliangii]UUI74866.1 WXG100 family type VII secretion target [Cellulomonas chengniuliangii]
MAVEVSAADGALKQGATAVAQSKADLQRELSALEGKLAGIGSHWQGQGAVAFSALMARWREDAQKIVRALDDFEANLVSSQSTYTAADDAQQSAMSRLQGRLG